MHMGRSRPLPRRIPPNLSSAILDAFHCVSGESYTERGKTYEDVGEQTDDRDCRQDRRLHDENQPQTNTEVKVGRTFLVFYCARRHSTTALAGCRRGRGKEIRSTRAIEASSCQTFCSELARAVR